MSALRTIISRTGTWGFALLAAVVLGGTVLRVLYLNAWSMSDDEWYTYAHATRIGEVAYSDLQPSTRSYPAIYFLTRLALVVFDEVELASRFFPCLFGIVSLPIFFILAAKAGGREGAAVATLLLALSPWHIYYSQTARFYTGAFLFSMIALFLLYRGFSKPNLAAVWFGAFSLLVAVLFHPSSAFVLLGFLVYAASAGRVMNRVKLPGARYYVPLLLILLFGVLSAIVNYGALEKTVIEGFSKNPAWAYSALDFLKRSLYYVGIHSCLLAAYGLFSLWRRGDPIAYYLLLAVGLAFLSLLAMAVLGISVGPRYLFPVTSALFLLAGHGGHFLLRGILARSRVCFCTAVMVILVPGLPSFVSYYQDGNRFDYREAAEYVGTRFDRGDRILSQSHAILSYYLGLNQEAREDDIQKKWYCFETRYDLSGDALQNLIGRAQRIWVVVPRSRLESTGFYAEDFKDFVQNECTLEKVVQRPRFDYTRNELMIYLSYRESSNP